MKVFDFQVHNLKERILKGNDFQVRAVTDECSLIRPPCALQTTTLRELHKLFRLVKFEN